MLSKIKLVSLFCTLTLAACADNPFGTVDDIPGGDGPPATTGGVGTTTGDSGGIGPGDGGTDTGEVTGGSDTGIVEPPPPTGCGDFSGLAFDFNDNNLPPGFAVINNPNFVNGQIEMEFPATPAGGAFTPLTQGIISTAEIPINEGRLVARIPSLPPGSNIQVTLKLSFGTNNVGGVDREIAAEVGRGPGQGFLTSRDGVDNNALSFDDTGIVWLGMRLDATTVYAESSVDGVTWKEESQVPRLGDTNAKIQIQSHQSAASANAFNIAVDDLNTNCPE